MSERGELIEELTKRHVDEQLIQMALDELNSHALVLLFEQIGPEDQGGMITAHIVADIVRQLTESNKLLQFSDSLFAYPRMFRYAMLIQLIKLGEFDEAMSIWDRRENLERVSAWRWQNIYAEIATYTQWYGDFFWTEKEVAWAFFSHFHRHEDTALDDELELVRQVAIDDFEQEHNIAAMLKGLRNDLIYVRRKSAWYMGRKKVHAATDTLIEMLTIENDIETLRGVIWSLGVMRVHHAKSMFQQLTEHDDLLIRSAATQALAHLTKD